MPREQPDPMRQRMPPFGRHGIGPAARPPARRTRQTQLPAAFAVLVALSLLGVPEAADGFAPTARRAVRPPEATGSGFGGGNANANANANAIAHRNPGPIRGFGAAKTNATPTRLGMLRMPALPVASTSWLFNDRIMRVAESWAPSVGVLMATLIYLAPAKAVWRIVQKARKGKAGGSTTEGDPDPLNGLNPLPIAIMPAVAVSWFAYGLVASDPYLVLGNLPGAVLSVAYLIGILPVMQYNASYPDSPSALARVAAGAMENPAETLLKPPKRSGRLFWTHFTVLLSAAATLGLWATLALMTSGAYGDFHVGGLEFGMGYAGMQRKGIIAEGLGVYAAGLFILLGVSPLSTIRTVLETKNSQSILGLLTAAQVVNTGLWTAYGLAGNDVFVWGPNVIGFTLGLIQMALKLLFPSRKPPKNSMKARRRTGGKAPGEERVIRT